MPLGCPLKRLEFTCEDLDVKATSRKYECNHCHQKKLGRAIPTLYNHYIKCPKVKDDKKNKYDSNGQLIGKEKGYSIDTANAFESIFFKAAMHILRPDFKPPPREDWHGHILDSTVAKVKKVTFHVCFYNYLFTRKFALLYIYLGNRKDRFMHAIK